MHNFLKPRIFALLLLATLAGCVLLEGISVREPVFGMSHAVHFEEGLECLDCHVAAEDSDEPGMPRLAQCMLCHEDIDAEKAPERRIDQLFDGKEFIRGAAAVMSEELLFSHQQHVANDYDCSACHTGIETNDLVAELRPVGMDDCMACHAEESVANECATCHTEIDESWTPDSHAHNWEKLHGQAARFQGAAQSDNCQVCHSESSCVTCHQEELPDNHTNYWRRRGHGVGARLDRDNCAACHQTADFCSRCHEETTPMSHRGMWGSQQNTHCLSCHFPLRAEGCLTCHKSTPSHLEAAPLPDDPPHSPGLNCRQCHGITAPLPHVDKGDECIACHR